MTTFNPDKYDKNRLTGKAYFRDVFILHLALIIGPSLIALVLIYVSEGRNDFANGANKTLLLLIAGLVLLAFFAGNYIFSSQIKKLRKENDLFIKMTKLRKVFVSRFAFFEAAALISILLFFIFKDWAFLAYGIVMILYMVIKIPNKRNTYNLLQLTKEEIRLIERDEEIIAVR